MTGVTRCTGVTGGSELNRKNNNNSTFRAIVHVVGVSEQFANCLISMVALRVQKLQRRGDRLYSSYLYCGNSVA